MVSAYKKQKNNFPKWMEDVKILPIWDDHDYGLNDAGSEYPQKRQSQEIYLNFWEIPLDDDRHNRDGIYFSEEKIIQGKVFKLIFLDTRAVAKGKKLFDKRQVKKTRDWNREKARLLSKNNK